MHDTRTLAIVWFLVREGREAWRSEAREDCEARAACCGGCG
jgi:hypothetical protein